MYFKYIFSQEDKSTSKSKYKIKIIFYVYFQNALIKSEVKLTFLILIFE